MKTRPPLWRIGKWLLVALLICESHLALAQPVPSKSPGSTHLFPAGGRIGSSLQVRVGAECIPPGTHFQLNDPRITSPALLQQRLANRGEESPRRAPTETPITYPREWASQVNIPDNMDPGIVYWKLSCAAGGTPWRPFIVGTLPEFVETESNSTLETAHAVTTPVTLNGQIHGERDVDYYRVDLETDQLLVCEMMAGRIGSRLDPVVEILNSAGEKVQVTTCHVGTDPVIALRAPEAGSYLLRISNISFHGSASHVYRLNLTHKPFVQAVFPRGGQAGTDQELDFLLLDGTPEGSHARQRVNLPARNNTGQTSFEYPLVTPWQSSSITVTSGAHQREKEPNDSQADAMPMLPGETVHGQFSQTTDQDWFRLSVKKGIAYSITCQGVAPLHQANPIMTVHDVAGKKLKEISSIETNGRLQLHWNASRDEDLLLRVRDLRFGVRGDFSLIYQLNVVPAVTDFQLHIPTNHVQVLQGGKTTVDLEITRSGKSSEPITVTATNLPAGVQLEKLEISPGKTLAKMVFSAKEDAAAKGLDIQVRGTRTINNASQQRLATIGHLGVDAEGRSVGTPTLNQIPFTVLHKPIFRIYCSEAYLYAYRGSVFPYLMEVERQAGFQGKIVLQIGDRQNRDLDGIEMHEIEIPATNKEVLLPIYLPETMHINIQSQSQLYCQGFASFTDQHGQQQSFLAVSEKRNMLRTLPPVVKLKSSDQPITCHTGQSLAVRLQLERTSNFPGPMTVSLLADPIKSGCSLKPATIPGNANEITCQVQIGQITGTRKLTFRAAGQMAGQTVITETQIHLQIIKKTP
ncbi:MAG: hypothetical protein VB877_13030 [Pirellulaceae bacterium]